MFTRNTTTASSSVPTINPQVVQKTTCFFIVTQSDDLHLHFTFKERLMTKGASLRRGLEYTNENGICLACTIFTHRLRRGTTASLRMWVLRLLLL